MANDNRALATQACGFLDLLGLTFIILKLTAVINWSWWMVTLPLWGPLAGVLAVIAVLLVIAGTAGAVDHFVTSRRKRVQQNRGTDDQPGIRGIYGRGFADCTE